MERRLTTILAVDAVGYSRLISEDETGTLAALKAVRVELIDPKASQQNFGHFSGFGSGDVAEEIVRHVSLQTARAKGCLTNRTALAMFLKLAERRWSSFSQWTSRRC